MFSAGFLQVFPAAYPSRVEFRDSPEERAIVRWTFAGANGQQVFAVEQVFRIGHRAGNCENGRGPIHSNRRLFGNLTSRNHTGPAQNRRHARSALPEIAFRKREWPIERVSLAAVI